MSTFYYFNEFDDQDINDPFHMPEEELTERQGEDLTESLPQEWSAYCARYEDAELEEHQRNGSGNIADMVYATAVKNEVDDSKLFSLLDKLLMYGHKDDFDEFDSPPIVTGVLSLVEVVDLQSHLSDHERELRSKYYDLLLAILKEAQKREKGILVMPM